VIVAGGAVGVARFPLPNERIETMDVLFEAKVALLGETVKFAVMPYEGTAVDRWRAVRVRDDGTMAFPGGTPCGQDASPHGALGRAVTHAAAEVLARHEQDRRRDTEPTRDRDAEDRDGLLAVAAAPTQVGAATLGFSDTVPAPLVFVSKEDRADGLKATIDAAVEQLAEQLAAGHTARFREVLHFFARFHRYSFNNMLLIRAQRPDATRVAGLRTWGELGYTVKKGERAIWIWCPITRNEPSPATGELVETVVGFRPGPVFDAGQLKEIGEKPLPEPFAPLPDDQDALYHRIQAHVTASGIAVVEEPLPAGVQGVNAGGRIAIRPGLDSRNRIFVLLHELAHELGHQGPGRESKTAQQLELEAESAAFVVASALGLELPTSRDYLLTWNGTADQLRASLATIQYLVRRVHAIVQPNLQSRSLAA
jgi:hypothetical protein